MLVDAEAVGLAVPSRISKALKNGAATRKMGWEDMGYSLDGCEYFEIESVLNTNPIKFHRSHVAIAPASEVARRVSYGKERENESHPGFLGCRRSAGCSLIQVVRYRAR